MSIKIKTSFGWKRKAGENLQEKKKSLIDNDSDDNDELVDWMSLLPKKPTLSIEDQITKSIRLKNEGIALAELERFWEAILKWNEAIQLNSRDEKLFEMKAQALMSVGEVEPALEAAETTVNLAPVWWVGYQTLGRAYANAGNVKSALKSFSRAVHLNPAERELWEEDLLWAKSLSVKLIDNDRGIKIQKCQERLTDSDSDSESEDTDSSDPG